jgi:hypothetical protein
MTKPFFFKLVNYVDKSNLLINLYTCSIIIFFLININLYDNNDIYISFLDFIKTFPKKITNKELIVFNISKEDFYDLYNEFTNDETIIKNIKDDQLINIFYNLYSTNKQFKHKIKEFNLYFTDLKYIDYIDNFINNTKSNNICNLFSGFGKFIYNTYDEKKKYLLVDENIYVVLISYINMLIKYNEIQNINFKIQNIITEDVTNYNYDLVLADLPDDIKNLIYANCNSKIKFLKIRGTKSEPLIVQYITQILNKTGTAIIITSNSLLFGDSTQHILTRKYIFENFGVEVIDLNNKKSLLILNRNKTNKIFFKFFDNNDVYEFIQEDIIKNSYSFYYYNYYKNLLKNTYLNTTKIENVLDIKLFEKSNNNINYDVLYSFKNNNFKIDKIENIDNADYVFISKDDNEYRQEFLNNELLALFNKSIQNITKGKMKILNLDRINELNINILDVNFQNQLIQYNKNTKQILQIISTQIEMLESFKNKYIDELINNKNKIKIQEICEITHESNNKNTIYINRNTNNAGTINLTNTEKENTTNNYYLHIKNSNFLHDYVYYILLYYEKEFIKLANSNKTISLNRKSVENFEIPYLNIDEQQKIIDKNNKINSDIHTYLNFNDLFKLPFSLFF